MGGLGGVVGILSYHNSIEPMECCLEFLTYMCCLPEKKEEKKDGILPEELIGLEPPSIHIPIDKVILLSGNRFVEPNENSANDSKQTI